MEEELNMEGVEENAEHSENAEAGAEETEIASNEAGEYTVAAANEELQGSEDGSAQQVAKSRAQERIQRQQSELRAAREAAEEASRKSADLERRMQELQAAQDRARETEQLQYMTPEERAAYTQQQQFLQMQRQLERVQFEMQDNTDRATFAAKAATNSMYSKYQEQVEAELSKMRQRGQTAPRESVLAYLVGQEVIRKGPSAAAKQRNAGAQRVANAQGSPASARGSAAKANATEGDSLEALEARLANAVF